MQSVPEDTPLDPDLIARINREHLIETRIAPADLLFVFGTRHGVDEFVAEAARLWRARFYRHAIVSGGATLAEPEPEAAVIKRLMIDAGVPGDIILTEDTATNTGENVILSLPVLDQAIGLAKIGSVIALGKLCTSRRYLMTLERHWPDVDKMLVAVNWFGVPRDDWHRYQLSRARVLREYEKIAPYLARGFIAPWPAAK
jgi:uncharacterized SAM-binding protein YcdF (DUF218 family)